MKKAASQPTLSQELEQLMREQWLAAKLDMPLGWDTGITTAAERQAAIRAYILENELADTVIARTRERGAITPRSAYHRLFKVPLVTDELNFEFTAQGR